MYVLKTKNDGFFVEYLFNKLVMSDSESEAMKFKNYENAEKFKTMLLNDCDLEVVINQI